MPELGKIRAVLGLLVLASVLCGALMVVARGVYVFVLLLCGLVPQSASSPTPIIGVFAAGTAVTFGLLWWALSRLTRKD